MGARWSDTVQDYYPVFPQPRWGFNKPPHAGLQLILETVPEHVRGSLRRTEQTSRRPVCSALYRDHCSRTILGQYLVQLFGRSFAGRAPTGAPSETLY